MNSTANHSDEARIALTIRNNLPSIEEVKSAVADFAAAHGIPVALRDNLRVVLDELINNIIRHAYTDSDEHQIDVEVALRNRQLTATLRDDGIPFDPFTYQVPDTDLPLEQREVGGLGIHLVRQMMDAVSYTRSDSRNIVTVLKKL
ncbi:ATP-binding protein [bacterium]|nr:ATP-binding protein [bacterium]